MSDSRFRPRTLQPRLSLTSTHPSRSAARLRKARMRQVLRQQSQLRNALLKAPPVLSPYQPAPSF